MKKLFTLFMVLLGTTFLVHAQTREKKSSRNKSEFAFGVKGGLNLTNLRVRQPQATYDSRTGYHAGLFMRGRFFNIGLQPELLLFTQGSTLRFGSSGTISDQFTYLSTPVMLKFYPIGGINLQIGPQFGFLIDASRDVDMVAFSGTRNIRDAYKDSDISLSLGGGWDSDFGLSLDVRYNIGMKDLNNDNNTGDTRSRIFLVSAGWNFLR